MKTQDTTVIRIGTDLWKHLNKLKEPGDTFDDVIRRQLKNSKEDN